MSTVGTAPPARAATKPFSIVPLGDSVASGEGTVDGYPSDRPPNAEPAATATPPGLAPRTAANGTNHRWCSPQAWAYGLSIFIADPARLSSQAPFHPTPDGQRRYAALVTPVARAVLGSPERVAQERFSGRRSETGDGGAPRSSSSSASL